MRFILNPYSLSIESPRIGIVRSYYGLILERPRAGLSLLQSLTKTTEEKAYIAE